MFVDPEGARRIEAAEAQLMREMVGALAHVDGSFVREVGGGAAVFVRPGSPMNKVIGAGLAAPIPLAELAAVEEGYLARGEPVRVELSTLATPESARELTARGYRLSGFENVLCRAIAGAAAPPPPDGLEIWLAHAHELADWKRVTVDGFAHSDDSGVPADAHTRDAIAQVIDDVLAARSVGRYLARKDGERVGAASLHVHGEVALLAGSTTLVAHRRRGVQGALIARRLKDAAAQGATLAIITTAPGTQSQSNVMKRGFSLAYARAILVREVSWHR